MADIASHDLQRTEGRVGSPALVAAAIALLILSVLEVVALGAAPRAADGGPQVVAWFREHRDAVRWWAWITTVISPVYAVVIALLRRLLPAPHRDVFLIGAIALGVANALQVWIWAGLALHADRLEPATARTLLDVAIFWAPVLTGATTTMMAPIALLALRSAPRGWIARVGWASLSLVAFIEQAMENGDHLWFEAGFTEPRRPHEPAGRGASHHRLARRLRAVGRLARSPSQRRWLSRPPDPRARGRWRSGTVDDLLGAGIWGRGMGVDRREALLAGLAAWGVGSVSAEHAAADPLAGEALYADVKTLFRPGRASGRHAS